MSKRPTLNERIEALRLAQDFAGALSLADQGLAADPSPLERGQLLAARGRVLLDTGANRDAASLFEAGLRALDQGYPGERAELSLELGRALRRDGRLELSLRALEQATDLFANAGSTEGRRRALAARGKVLYAMHDWKAARGAFRAALEHGGDEPLTWRLHHALARAYEKDGRRGEAEAAYEEARQAGWEGLAEEGGAQRVEEPALTISAGDVLVPRDDESEVARAAGALSREDLVRIVSLAGALNSALAPGPTLELLLDRGIEWTGAQRGYVVLCEPRKDGAPQVVVRAARGRGGQQVESPEDEISRSIVLETVSRSAPLVTSDAAGDSRLMDQQSVMERELRSVACLPLRVHSGPTLGALYLESRERAGLFGEREVALLDALVHYVGLAFERSTRYQRLAEAYNETRRALEEKTGTMFGLIGKARSMREVFRTIDRLRDHDAPVLIEGETGTGKELIARAIHRSSRRRDAPFVVEACGSLPEGLLEAELFGHEKGAFTGASESRRGAFERAEGGTLFLDELPDMPARMQALLLRALESGEVRPLGAPSARVVDCRIVCATREPLTELVRSGRFREDLYFRVNVIRLEVPPLRERREDIPALAEAFLRELDRQPADLSPLALEAFLRHTWPGNIRELRHTLERAALLAGSGMIEPQHLGLDLVGGAEGRRGLGVSSTTTVGKVEWNGYVLSRRQITLIDYLRANGFATNRDYVDLVKVSVPTGWRDLQDLLQKGLVLSEGRGRTMIYRLSDSAPKSGN